MEKSLKKKERGELQSRQDSSGGGRADAGNGGDKGCGGIVCMSVYNCRSLS